MDTTRSLLLEFSKSGIAECSPEPPTKVDGIPTFAPGVQRDLSIQFAARFEFCSGWTDAPTHSWLSHNEMTQAPTDPKISEIVSIHQECWEGSVPDRFPPEQFGIFSVWTLEFEIGYIFWPDEGREPQLEIHHAQCVYPYENFNAYLRFWLGRG